MRLEPVTTVQYREATTGAVQRQLYGRLIRKRLAAHIPVDTAGAELADAEVDFKVRLKLQWG